MSELKFAELANAYKHHSFSMIFVKRLLDWKEWLVELGLLK